MIGARFVAVLGVGLPLMAACLPGCTVTTDPGPVIVAPVPAGTLIVDWTIELRADPAACGFFGAAFVEIHVVSSSGFDAGTYEQACEAFSTAIVLDPGTYSSTALLLDVGRRPRSTTVVIAPFTIYGNDVISTPIDFPANSFF